MITSDALSVLAARVRSLSGMRSRAGREQATAVIAADLDALAASVLSDGGEVPRWAAQRAAALAAPVDPSSYRTPGGAL